jgi:hypothetical protein
MKKNNADDCPHYAIFLVYSLLEIYLRLLHKIIEAFALSLVLKPRKFQVP